MRPPTDFLVRFEVAEQRGLFWNERCMAPAVNGWSVCRFHGAGGGAPKGKANGSYRHGLYTQEAKAERRWVSDLLRQSRKAIGT
jgi:hypothetical protein